MCTLKILEAMHWILPSCWNFINRYKFIAPTFEREIAFSAQFFLFLPNTDVRCTDQGSRATHLMSWLILHGTNTCDCNFKQRIWWLPFWSIFRRCPSHTFTYCTRAHITMPEIAMLGNKHLRESRSRSHSRPTVATVRHPGWPKWGKIVGRTGINI
jgi:hypothetical protein